MKKRIIISLLILVMIFLACTSFASAATQKTTGLYKEKGRWVYYENGRRSNATGLVQKAGKNTWHYVEKGVFKSVTGLVQCVQPGSNKNQWFYVYKGNMKSVTGLVKCAQPGSDKGKYFYVVNGKKNTATGIVKGVQPKDSRNGKYYYVKDGLLNSYTGVAKCIQPGKLNGKYYNVKNGKASTSKAVAAPKATTAAAPAKVATTATTVKATTTTTTTTKTTPATSIGLPNGTMKKYTEIGYAELCNNLQQLIDQNKIVRYKNYFAGHNPGAMSHVSGIAVGSKVRVSDGKGGYKDYTIKAHTTGKGSFADVNFAKYGNLWDIVQRGGLVIQFCKNGTNNFFYGE